MSSNDTEDFKATSKVGWFKKGTKREESAYPMLQDENISAKSHECEQVLDPD